MLYKVLLFNPFSLLWPGIFSASIFSSPSFWLANSVFRSGIVPKPKQFPRTCCHTPSLHGSSHGMRALGLEEVFQSRSSDYLSNEKAWKLKHWKKWKVNWTLLNSYAHTKEVCKILILCFLPPGYSGIISYGSSIFRAASAKSCVFTQRSSSYIRWEPLATPRGASVGFMGSTAPFPDEHIAGSRSEYKH